MSQTLYRKYRPTNFSEVIGQQHVIQTLSNAVKNSRTGQAYLFTGPRGTGKTSIARILAKTINCANLVCKNENICVTCEKCDSCRLINEKKSLDIIEIDAASNTGVDNIRELRETVSLPPTALKFKVYIIDEVHMLSMGAFNALLKTLEEPPAHVVFILATTEIHKVPETIISRCQRFDFSRLPIQNIIEKLSLIAKKEKIKIDRESLEMIAIAAEGGMRDAESLLGQIIALEDKNITRREVEEILGTTDRNFSHELADLLIADNSASAIEKINSLVSDGFDLEIFGKNFINYLRQLMLVKIDPELKKAFTYEMSSEQTEKIVQQSKKIELQKIINCINLFLEAQEKISRSILPQLPLEIAIIKATGNFPQETTSDKKESGYQIRKAENFIIRDLPVEEEPAPTKEAVLEEKKSADDGKPIDMDMARSNWNRLLEEIASHNHSLKALLLNCQVLRVEDKTIFIATPFDFYKEKLNDTQTRLTVEQVFGKILGSKITLRALSNKEAGITPTISSQTGNSDRRTVGENAGEQNSLLASAMEIMGGKIVTE